MCQAICFDLDGTLFDDRQYVRAGLRNAAARLEAETDVDLTDDLLAAYFERGVREGTFDTVLAEHGLELSRVPDLVDAYHDNSAELTPFPGTEAALSTLATSHKMGLITGGRNGLDKLDRLGLTDYFDAVCVTSGSEHSKRDPEPFEEMLDSFGVPAESAIYVGDRPGLDFLQPNCLGMETVRVATGQYADVDATGSAQPDTTIDSVRELPALLGHSDPISETQVN